MSVTPERAHADSRGASARPPAVTLRAAGTGDCRQIWLWRNDPETRQASFDSEPIALETHERWFQESLARADRKLYVILADAEPAGAARLDVEGSTATVSLHLAPQWRGRRVGLAALRALTELAFETLAVDKLVASVKLENTRSLSAFERAGFTRMHEGSSIELVRVRREG